MTLPELLSDEHRLIQEVANSALGVCDHYRDLSEDEAWDLVEKFSRFFHEFCKKVHRPKEELLLFPWLESSEEQRILEMIRILRADHLFSDELLRKLSQALVADRKHPDRLGVVVALITRYGTYLLQHTAREEEMLLPVVRYYINRAAPLSVTELTIDSSNAATHKWDEELYEVTHPARY